MYSKFRRRRKSMGATSTNVTNGDVDEQRSSRRKSILDFFRRSRRRRQSDTKENDAGDEDSAAGADDATSKQELERDNLRKESSFNGEHSTADPPPPEPVDAFLTEDDVRHLFSGAPQFSAQMMGGRVQASASFPWDFNLQTRNLRDARQIAHAAFSGCTLYPHLPQWGVQNEKDTMSYDIGLRELPSMLASTGNEPGTVGIGFFVEEPDADILETYSGSTQTPDEVFENFSNFELLESQPEKLGIRSFDFNAVVERLVELSSIYEASKEKDRAYSLLNRAAGGELYASLFGKILTPPKFDNGSADPTGLKVQIQALMRILQLQRTWYDFGNVEWRIRVGQLLFSDGNADMTDSNLSEPEDGLSERDVVLLQLLLACELYARLEAVANLSLEEIKNDLRLTSEDVNNFRDMENAKTRWDLVLARRFLENVDAKTFLRPKIMMQSEKSLTRTLLGMSQRESAVKVDEVDVVFEPRRQNVQVNGLYHFAQELDWPDRNVFQQNLDAALSSSLNIQAPASPSIYATPLSTPGTMTPRSFRSDRESGYFANAVGSASPEMTPRSFQLSPPSRLDLNASISDTPELEAPKSIGGWLTRSYLTGLVLPGEAICHLLISAILENDAESIAALGENANLYGGFVYKGRSFWSKSCVVGRVVACLEGSSECMGWISSTVIPEGYGDGWLDVSSAPTTLKRIEIEDEGLEDKTHFLGGKQPSSTRSSELTMPSDDMLIGTRTRLALEALRLEPNTPTVRSRTGSEPVLSSSLVFVVQAATSQKNNAGDSHNIPLSHLVQFISAYPCATPPVAVVKHAQKTKSSDGHMPPASSVHPLHESYEYRCIDVLDLLDPKLDTEQIGLGAVLVINAKGSATRELLARAWCSSAGLNAIIARVGITCLSCAIREAKGIDVRILIRIG